MEERSIEGPPGPDGAPQLLQAARQIEPLDVGPPAVEVEGEELPSIFERPSVTLVDHQAAVGVAAPSAVMLDHRGRGARA